MVTLDFRPEVEIWPFRARAVKNMQYNRYYRNSSVTVNLAVSSLNDVSFIGFDFKELNRRH